MKIYFAGSIRGGRKDVELYKQIIDYLRRYGEVLTEHIGNKNLAVLGEDRLSDAQIHQRDLGWVLESRAMVAEVTTPSLGVGYEIGRAVENDIPILCLHRPRKQKRLSAMIAGCPDVVNKQYGNLREAEKAIDEFFKTLVRS